jgi:hypothetical protein
MINDTKEHLKNSRMSYFKHMTHSLYNGWRSFIIVLSSIVHAFFPSILKQHAARGIVRIYNDMKKHAHIRKMIKEENANQSD